MRKFEKSVFIDTPVERVFDYMTWPSNLPDIWPSLIDVENVERKEDGSHRFDWTYKMAGVRFHGHSEATVTEKNRTVIARNEGGIGSTFRYRYEPSDGGTQLSLEVEYEVPRSVLEKLAEPIITRINEREADSLLKNLKELMEYGGGTGAAE